MASDEYRGTMYFSETMPKGADKADNKFNPVMYKMVKNMVGQVHYNQCL